MSSDYPESSSYPSDYGNGPYHSNGSSIQSLQDRIQGYEERILLLKKIKKDGDTRLAAQAADIARRNREIAEMKERMEKELQMNDKRLSDAALSVRTRERKIIKLNDQNCKHTMTVQRLQRSKHQIDSDAKKELREEMREEREQRQAVLDIQNSAAGRSYSRRAATSNDMGRRTPSSGSFFSRGSTGGGSGGGAANGGNTGRARK